MNDVWKALCPQFVNSVQGLDQEDDKKILENLVKILKKLDINSEEDDFRELLESHSQELTNEELMELETMQRPEEETFSEKKFETKLMPDGFGFIGKALAIFENQDRNVERFSTVAISVCDSFQCYCIIYDEKKRTVKTSLNQFFSKRSDPQENVKSVENLQENVEPMPSSPPPSSSSAASYSDRSL